LPQTDHNYFKFQLLKLKQSKFRDKESVMNIVCLGGGPAGLYFGLLMKLRHPEHKVKVLERNKPYDTFGWGVVAGG